MGDDRTLSGFLGTYAEEHNTTAVDLSDLPAGASCYLVVRCGERAAVVNVINAGKHLSVDVRGYLHDDEHPSRLVAFGEGWAMHVPGEFPLAAVVVGETERPARPQRRSGQERRSGQDRRQS